MPWWKLGPPDGECIEQSEGEREKAEGQDRDLEDEWLHVTDYFIPQKSLRPSRCARK